MSWNNKRGWSRQQDAEAILRSLSDLYLNPNKPNGLRFPKLDPRTLQNGVSNGDYQQNVSGDVVLQASDITGFSVSNVNNNVAVISNSVLTGMINLNVTDTIATKLASSITVPRNNLPNDSAENIYTHSFTNAGNWNVFLPKSIATLAQAQAILVGTVIRYQLATPIDTLNSPFVNPMIDLKGVVGKNLFDIINVYKYNTLLQANGVEITNTNYNIYGTILVTPNTQYTLTFNSSNLEIVRFCEYTDNDIFIRRPSSNIGGSTVFTTTATTRKVKLCFNPVQCTQVQLELGSVATSYEPYGKANVLMTNVGWTSADGYRVEPLINDYKGSPVTFANLLGNDGNMIDSNADNRADGWVLFNATAVSCIANEAVFLPTSQGGYMGVTAAMSTRWGVGDLAYFCAYVKATSNLDRVQIYNGSSSVNTPHSGSGQYEFLSIQSQINALTANIAIISNRTSGFANITAKQSHVFLINKMFPDPSRRPTQAQMDSLVKDAIARYGYVNERIIKIAWEVFFNLDGSDTFGRMIGDHFTGLTDNYGYTVVCKPLFSNEYRAMFSFGETNRYTLKLKFRNDGSLYFVNPLTTDMDNLNEIPNAYSGGQLTYYTFVRISGVNKVYVNGNLAKSVASATMPISAQATYYIGLDTTANEYFKGLVGIMTFHTNITDEAKLLANTKKLMKQQYGLGV